MNNDPVEIKKVHQHVDPEKTLKDKKKTSQGRVISKKKPDSEVKQPPKPQDTHSTLPPELRDFRVTPRDKHAPKKEEEKKPVKELPPALRDFRVTPRDKHAPKKEEEKKPVKELPPALRDFRVPQVDKKRKKFSE